MDEYEAEKKLAEEYMEDWNDWMNAPLGLQPEDQAHLDSTKAEK